MLGARFSLGVAEEEEKKGGSRLPRFVLGAPGHDAFASASAGAREPARTQDTELDAEAYHIQVRLEPDSGMGITCCVNTTVQWGIHEGRKAVPRTCL